MTDVMKIRAGDIVRLRTIADGIQKAKVIDLDNRSVVFEFIDARVRVEYADSIGPTQGLCRTLYHKVFCQCIHPTK